MQKLLRLILFTIIILSLINVSYSDEPNQLTPMNAPLHISYFRQEFHAINVPIYICFCLHDLQGAKNVPDGVDENVYKSYELYEQPKPNPPSPTNAPLHISPFRQKFHAINVAIYISFFLHELQWPKNVPDGLDEMVFKSYENFYSNYGDSQPELLEGSYEKTQPEPNPPPLSRLPKIPNTQTKPSPPSQGRPCIPRENPHRPTKPYHPSVNRSPEVIRSETKPSPAVGDRFRDSEVNLQTQIKSVIRTKTPAWEDRPSDLLQKPQTKKKSVLANNPILSPLSAITHGIGGLVQDGMEAIHNTTKSGTQGIKQTTGKLLDAIGIFGK